jgi:hypothetical protein
MISHISGAVITLAGVFIAVTTLVRMRSPRARRVLSQTAGSQFRLSLGVVTGGIVLLLIGWANLSALMVAVVLAWAAIVIWDRYVWLSNRTRQPS